MVVPYLCLNFYPHDSCLDPCLATSVVAQFPPQIKANVFITVCKSHLSMFNLCLVTDSMLQQELKKNTLGHVF